MANEKRLIDANAIKYTEYRGGGGRDYPENIVTEYEIAKLPTVDAVEVVRCQWCKHYGSITGVCYVDRKLGQTIPPIRVKHSDFCSYGERKDNDRQRETD